MTKSQRDLRYEVWLAQHQNSVQLGSLLKMAWDEAWRQGCWAGIHENARLGVHVLELKESIAHLEQRLGIIAEDEEDWHTDEPA